MIPIILQSSFVQTALPIMFTILVAVWVNNRSAEATYNRFDDMRALIVSESARLEAALKLEFITELGKLETRVNGLEDRAGLLYRG